MAASHTFVFVRSADEDSGGVSAQSSSTSSPGGARHAEGKLRNVPGERGGAASLRNVCSTRGRADMSRCPQRQGKLQGNWLVNHEVSVLSLRIRGSQTDVRSAPP